MPHEYSLVRQYLESFVVGWWSMFVVQSGQDTILQETPFGGYRFRLKWRDWFWANSAGTGRIDDVIEHLYAIAPDHTTIVHAGQVGFNVQLDPLTRRYMVVIQNEPNDNHYCMQQFPPVNPDYWHTPTPYPYPSPYLYTS